MKRYSKFVASLVGAAGVGLVSFGVVDAGEAEALTATTVALLSAFGVYQVSNGD